MSAGRLPSQATTLGDVKRELRRLIEDNAGLPGDVIHDDSTVDGDLAMDSMSLLSLQVAVEESFGITFAPEDLETSNRFDAIAALIFERVTATSGTKPQGTRSAHGTKQA
jgi:acyl carrier protein